MSSDKVKKQYENTIKKLAPQSVSFGPITDVISFGDFVYKARKYFGENTADVARTFGVSVATVLRWERGETEPARGGKKNIIEHYLKRLSE